MSSVLLVISSLASAAAGPDGRSQPLSSFLRELQASGAPIDFSEALVRPDMWVAVERGSGSLHRRVEALL